MRNRSFGRLGWDVGEVGYGMWGLAGWSGSDDRESLESLDRAIELGCNFFDTAWGYGEGRSEAILGEWSASTPSRSSMSPPSSRPRTSQWPSRRGSTLDDCFPPDHIREYAEKSLTNLGLPQIDLLQFHVWEDAWANDERWQRAVEDSEGRGSGRASGSASTAGSRPTGSRRLETGLIDAIQVIYNIFDQAPQDELLPFCEANGVAVIARVPFDEGTLTGTLTKEIDLARGGLARDLLRPRKPERERRPRRSAAAADPAGDVDARAGLALDLDRPEGRHGDPRDAQAPERRGEHERQRRAGTRLDPLRRAGRPPLGPDADRLVAVIDSGWRSMQIEL